MTAPMEKETREMIRRIRHFWKALRQAIREVVQEVTP